MNGFSQLGIGNTSNRNRFVPLTGNWSQIACGNGYTMALSAGTNALFGTGGNGSGQLGLGNTTNCNTLTQLTGNWSQVACGTNHTMALSAGTTALFSTGSNSVGQLGFSNTGVNKNTFTQVLGTGVNPSAVGNWSQVTCGYNYTMAQSAGTTRWFGTGDCAYGQLGVGMYGAGYALASFYQAQGNWSQMVCGESHTMAQSAGTNTWFGVGRNSEGQLGLGRFDTGGNIYYNNTFTQLTGDWSQMVCGQYHTMALSAGTNNKWFGTGYNTSGQLGLGNTTNGNTFTALTGSWLQMSCGGTFTMATWY
jgi:hypothetical protein